MQLVRRSLFDGDSMQISHVLARPSQLGTGPIECQTSNVLVMPLGGVFAKHDGPRRCEIVTPNHALFISIDTPYRLSFPGGIGDQCLALRFSPAALAQLVPQMMAGDRWHASAFSLHALLSPELMLARSLLWRRASSDAAEPLEIEELGISLLVSTLKIACDAAARSRATPRCSGSRRRQLGRVLEAISAAPEHSWTLNSLAVLAGVSSWHLAHVFQAELGLSVYGYVLRARLAKTLQAVLETDRELATIALDAGFASHSHFTARFRALFGVTPLALRRIANRKLAGAMRKIVTARAQVDR